MVAHSDARGVLVAPQSPALPFEVNNYFYIANVPPVEAVCCHSSCSDEALIVVHGSVMVDLDNGVEQASVLLKPAQVCSVCMQVSICGCIALRQTRSWLSWLPGLTAVARGTIIPSLI